MKRMTVVLLLLCAGTLFAQERGAGDLWLCPGAEASMYSTVGMAFGGGISLGYSRGATIGFKIAYFVDTDGLSALELNFLFRWYFLKSMRYSGPFIQFLGGPIFAAPDNGAISVPAEYGTISAGISAGWRFLLGEKWFVEPAIRAGYPYLIGAGVSAGVHF